LEKTSRYIQTGRTVLLLHELKERWGEVVAEAAQCLREFVPVDRAGAIAVKVPEHVLPIADVLPKASKLVKADCSTTIGILTGKLVLGLRKYTEREHC
jgi:hypothetical protein